MAKIFVIKEGIHNPYGEVIEIAEDADLFDKCRELIGCAWLEPVYSFGNSIPGLVLLVDEDGMMSGSHLANLSASIGAGVPIVGNAVVVRAGEDDFDTLTDDDLMELREFEYHVRNMTRGR